MGTRLSPIEARKSKVAYQAEMARLLAIERNSNSLLMRLIGCDIYLASHVRTAVDRCHPRYLKAWREHVAYVYVPVDCKQHPEHLERCHAQNVEFQKRKQRVIIALERANNDPQYDAAMQTVWMLAGFNGLMTAWGNK